MENFESILDKSRLMSPVSRLLFLASKMSDYSVLYASRHKELEKELGLLEKKYGESFNADSIYDEIFSNIDEEQEFLDFFDELIGVTIELIYSVYSIDESSILFNKEEIIFKNIELLYVSPFLFSFNLWKKIIVHDLLFSEGNLNEKKDKVIAVLNDLKFRIKNEKIWDVWESFEGKEVMVIHGCAGSFNVDINDYIDFVSEIDSKNTVNVDNLLDDIKEHRKKIKNRSVGVVKLNKNCSKVILVKGLTDLLRSMNLDLPEDLNDLIKGFVDYVLKGDVNSFNNEEFVFLKGKKNKANRVDFVKFFVFLSYSGYILNNQTDTITILSQFLNKNEDLGFGIRTLKGDVKKDNYFMFSDEIEGGKANKRQNLISTVFYSNEEVLNKYENSKACYDVKLHLSKKNKASSSLVS